MFIQTSTVLDVIVPFGRRKQKQLYCMRKDCSAYVEVIFSIVVVRYGLSDWKKHGKGQLVSNMINDRLYLAVWICNVAVFACELQTCHHLLVKRGLLVLRP